MLRLIGPDFRPDDLMGLFLFARDHCDGRESVTDIGDFIAHHDEREKGLITRSTREWCSVARYYASRFGPNGILPFDFKRMPPATRDYYKIAVNRIDASFIMQKTGMRRAKAYALMLELLKRITPNIDGTWALPNDLKEGEFKLIECVSSLMVIKPAFEGGRLCDDFLATLKSNGLITKDEMSIHRDELNVLIQLFAVATMHNSRIQIGDGTAIRLKGRPHDNRIAVNAAVPNAVPDQPNIFISCAMFMADLNAAIYCEPELRPNAVDWDFEIELAPDKRLRRL